MPTAHSELVEHGWRSVSAGTLRLLQRIFPERFDRHENLLTVPNPDDGDDAQQRRLEAWHQFRHIFEELRLPSIGEQEYSLVHRCRHVVDCLIARDRTSFSDALEQVIAYCDEFGIDVGDEVESLEDSLSAFDVKSVSLIWSPSKQLVVPTQLVALPNQLLHALVGDPKLIFKLTGREFEVLIAEVLEKHGFEVVLTATTRDHGRDIIAISSTLGMKTKYLIECKRYAERRKVDIGVVQRLFGVVIGEKANKGIVVTTSSFSSDARQFAAQHPWQLELRELSDVLAWLRNV